MSVTAGVIGVQGDVSEHAAAIERAAAVQDESVTVRTVRTAGIVPECDLLCMPGGESTTISRLIHDEGIAPEIREHVAAGKPVLATCAGLIVASSNARDERVRPLSLLDVTVERNAFGRQKDSFEASLQITGLDDPFPAVFIRAPVIRSVETGDQSVEAEDQSVETGEGTEPVEVLAEWNGQPVAVRQGSVVGTSFHPELTPDSRVHKLAFFDSRPPPR